MTGIEQELATIELGDQRLHARAPRLLSTLAADPQASINAACAGWSETQAAYRFFDNDHVDPHKLLQPHTQASKERIKNEDVVLLVQDTTELDYSHHPPRDAGLLNEPTRKGLYDHTHLAFTPQRLCLGVLQVDFFSRSSESLGKSKERANDPIETKESFRWLEGYRLACELQQEIPQTHFVSVADSEADLYELFLQRDQQERAADFVIRAKYDRCLTQKDPEGSDHTYLKVHNEVASTDLLCSREVHLPQTRKRAARDATLEIRATSVELKPPHGRSSLGPVKVQVVLVQEVDGPKDGTDVCWLLITTLPIDSVDAVLGVVDYYTARWPIEIFFRVYKTGCQVEEIQLETVERLEKCLIFYKVICWRLLYLTFLGRRCPELPCEVVFGEEEWKPVWKIVTKGPWPKSVPTLREFIPLLAELGGYNRRKKEGPPGAQVMWTAIRRMMDFALAWTAFGPEATSEG